MGVLVLNGSPIPQNGIAEVNQSQLVIIALADREEGSPPLFGL